jgi:sarcosine oxidase subunit alpha
MRDHLLKPLRRLATHPLQEAIGAVFEEYGGWARPAYYPREAESAHAAEQREALAVRRSVGLFEASPLGKIVVRGPDAAEFLDRVFANTLSSLKIGRARYGLMLNEMGIVIDDGITIRLADDHFVVGTTGAGAAHITSWLEEWLQCEWRELDVLTIPVTTAWGVLTLAGPKARAVLQAAGVDFPVTAAEFPHMTFREGHIAGIPARVVRASFTGELSYEINVPADRTAELWSALAEAGAPHDLSPVGIDAWMLLRTEKGYLHIGADTDGSTSLRDVGWGHVLKRPHDFIGRRSLALPGYCRSGRLEFVGLQAVDTAAALPIGAHLGAPGAPAGSEGYVTSTGFSPTLGRGVALGMVKSGTSRVGEELTILTADRKGGRVRIVPPCAYDPEGERLRA